ncbi:PadR family transcriptional regulator [Geodermatophilus sp. CPCC 206100]|uniref:PadR family transcriptional regulator n=1 Tax=Geodermatophilus sp. CPCC 206100 TaxID=3020054 RepID=UPI003AFFA5F2
MSTPSALTTTSYAILSLLAVRPWSTYELTRQMDRSVGRMWPRAQSKLYEEPKKLVAHGLATARSEAVGQRSRTVYSITPEGRTALAAWHREPGGGPVLEFEQLLKLSFAEHGSRADALATLAAARRWAEERNVENRSAAEAYASGNGPFPDRLPQNLLVGRFLTDFYRLVAEWADWATPLVEAWPEDPAAAGADAAQAAETARRADW